MKTNIIKRLGLIILAFVLLILFTACGETKSPTENSKDTTVSETQSEAENTKEGENKILVAFFSATGNTKDVAEKIATVTGGDIYEIKAAEEYTDADLNWNDKNSRSTKEQNDNSARPQIASDRISLAGYDTIYIGYPIWWGKEPRIMDTFVESYDFSGKTVIPFCTSGSSGIGSSGENLKNNAKSGKWLTGERFSAGATDKEIADFVNSIE